MEEGSNGRATRQRSTHRLHVESRGVLGHGSTVHTRVQATARDIEALGFGSIFFPEGGGKESLTQAATLLAATERLVVGTGIASIHARPGIVAEAGARTLSAAYPGRFILGLGVSHASTVETQFSTTYGKPLATMAGYLESMNEVPAHVEPVVGRPTRILAALGPKMIELAGNAADGAMPYLVTPEQTRTTRSIVGPDKLIVTEQAVAIGGTPEDQLRAREHLSLKLGLPNYRSSWLRRGFHEEDLVTGGSDRLVRAMVGLGSAEEAVTSVHAQFEAGTDHVVVQALGNGDRDVLLRDLAALAQALGH